MSGVTVDVDTSPDGTLAGEGVAELQHLLQVARGGRDRSRVADGAFGVDEPGQGAAGGLRRADRLVDLGFDHQRVEDLLNRGRFAETAAGGGVVDHALPAPPVRAAGQVGVAAVAVVVDAADRFAVEGEGGGVGRPVVRRCLVQVGDLQPVVRHPQAGVRQPDPLLCLVRRRQLADDAVADVRVHGLPAPVPAHHHVPALAVRGDAFDRLRVVVHHSLVGDDDVAVEAQVGQLRVDAPVEVLAAQALAAVGLAQFAAVFLLVGDDRLGHRPGAGEHRPAVPAVFPDNEDHLFNES
jgi:hypothetical protein